MSKKTEWMFIAAVMGMVVLSVTGCSRKPEPQMIDVASRLEQARAERAAYAAQQPAEVVQPAQTVQRKVSYVK